ncbi:MarR family transcriptional regulator [Sphingopyxis yananensis]|uniref:MarR family transcriptional regulator n=1 Tax=Sphingopyxis yananensis TaxID=2886687 RepID=UPI001D129289|nr:MarR family transcriptional regulator [Sphingopyxis yananensis]
MLGGDDIVAEQEQKNLLSDTQAGGRAVTMDGRGPDLAGDIMRAGAATVLVVGANGSLAGVSDAEDVRIVGDVPLDMAAERIEQMVRLDMVWLVARSDVTAGRYTQLYAMVAARNCPLICEADLTVLDSHMGRVPDDIAVQWLVQPEAVDRRMALIAAQPVRHMAVRDAARDEAMDRIDRLQDEVARISRLLGQLAGDAAPRPLDYGWPEHGGSDGRRDGVRAQSRSFYAMGRSMGGDDAARDRDWAKRVRRLIRQRRTRERFFPADLFADPAWDMLLDLFAARLERQVVSVSSLCIASAVPATTALRWIKTLTDAGLFLREADERDGRRIFIAMSDQAYSAMERYFEALAE